MPLTLAWANSEVDVKMSEERDTLFLKRAVALAARNVEAGGQPFGAVLVKDRQVLAEGVNQSHVHCDLTAHAEIQALRHAGQALGDTTFPGSTMYASGKPCAMCLAAMHLAHVSQVVYAADDAVGEPYGWSTAELYAELAKPLADQRIKWRYLPLQEKRNVYARWKELHGLP